ncbi:hypothetical protein HG536_0H03590 [Torulaspora globosa]|uniref:Uncharacterized protein n=1 Tax=Torulaspora globosa TaxID=48254 RepID=A0A7G3ZN97_9SACH|nr:uncharacterized protein HG536_0H03590 [Torulaspora globosa]QLL34983.1 hypothetical protein HG536_0H03590 [Torulaspora globosa]
METDGSQSQRMTVGSSSHRDKSPNEYQNETDGDPEKSRLLEEIEHIKKEQFTEPIIIKDEKSADGSESTPARLAIEAESPRAQKLAGKQPLAEANQLPSFGLTVEKPSGRSPSVAARGPKSFSGMAAAINGHNYFGSGHDFEISNEKIQLAPTTGIHGNTSKVVATQHRRKVWDWNCLPKVGSSVLVQTHSFNVISVPIDGEIKQILYTPLYNKNFKRMNIFLSFNMDTKPWDALVHSRKRIVSFVNYIKQYLKSRAYAYQCYPFFLQGLSEEDIKTQNYISYNTSYDYTEIESIISLWFIQAQRLLFSTNSIFFSPDVVQGLLQRRTSTRSLTTIQSSVFLQQSEGEVVTSRPVAVEPLEEIDILLLRSLPDDEFGWQLAYDEPNLNIVDYCLDTTPWTAREEAANNVSKTQESSETFQGAKIVSKQEDIERIDSENVAYCLFDCMDRRISDLTEDLAASAASAAPKTTSGDPGKSWQAGLNESSKKKGSHNKLGKRSGLASLFKRRHAHSIPQSTQSEVPAPSSPEGKLGGRAQSIQNAWLEDYFSKCLGNYKRVRMPTQYFLPQEANSSESERSEEDKKLEARKAFLYNKECLQIVLPFADNVIPSIYAPWLWSDLGYTKWKSLLREMIRCLVPGGFALASVYDLRLSNTFTAPTEESMQEFPTTMEREKTFDAMALEAMNHGIYVHPTKHLVQAFKEIGFTNIKYSILSLKTGDFSTDMGCLNELFSQITWDLLLRKQMPDPSKPPKDTDPPTLFQRYTTEHLDKVDDNAGCMRALLIVAQKPRKIACQ